MSQKDKIILIGGGGHCKSCIDVIENEGKFEIAGIIDKPELVGTKVLNYEIFDTDANLEVLHNKYKYAFITLGQIKSPETRIKIFENLKKIGYNLPKIISSASYVSKYSFIDEGTIIMHHALVNANAKIGKNCIINSKALIEHDSIIGDHCHISTAAIINGGVNIKKGSFFGSNAVSKEYVFTRENDFIKANSIFTGLK